MASIDQFKAQLLGGGPRANRFRVFIPRSGNKIEFLCQSAQIPAATVGVVEQQFRGHTLKLAGDRTFEPWTVTIINDVEFSSRSALEAWQTDIQELEKKVNSIFNNDVTSMLEKSKQLLEIKDDIKKEQDNINYMIDKISDLSPKKSKKFCKDTYSQKGFYN